MSDPVQVLGTHGTDSATCARVPCRQCGRPVELEPYAERLWQSCNERLSARGEAPLSSDELACCDAPECNAADASDRDEKPQREHEEFVEILARIKRGEGVTIPRGMQSDRPEQWGLVQRALRAARERRA